MPADIRVVHVDDDQAFLDLAARVVERERPGFTVETTTDPAAILDRLDGVDCVVCDYQMPEMDGLALFEAVRDRGYDGPFLLFTGKGSEEIASDAISAGVTDYLQKERGTEQFTVLANRVENAVEQHRTEERLDRRVRAMESASDGIAILDEDERYVYVNEAHADVYGYDPADFLGETWGFLYEAEERERIRDEIIPTLRSQGEWRGEATGVRADGSTFPQELSLTDTEGGLICVVRDVTDRRERERELREQQRRYRTLLQNLPGMVYRCRNAPDWPMEFVSDGCRDLTGYDPDDIVAGGTVWGENVIHPDEQGTLWDPVQRALDAREPFQLEYRIVTTDDEVRWVWEQGQGVYEADEVVALEGFITDVTERRRKTERLESFAHVLSHDIRSPLSVALAELEHARETGPTETAIEGAIDSLGRIEAITDELLDVAEGTRDVTTVTVSLSSVAGSVWDSLGAVDGRLVVDADERFHANRDAVVGVLENLFRNAVEHGSTSPDSQARQDAVEHGVSDESSVADDHRDGGVTVSVGPTEDGFYVADDGPGIHPDDAERIFEPGYTTSEDGTGYGLLSVRQLAHRHDWDVSVTESAAGGARFEVTGLTVARNDGD